MAEATARPVWLGGHHGPGLRAEPLLERPQQQQQQQQQQHICPFDWRDELLPRTSASLGWPVVVVVVAEREPSVAGRPTKAQRRVRAGGAGGVPDGFSRAVAAADEAESPLPACLAVFFFFLAGVWARRTQSTAVIE